MTSSSPRPRQPRSALGAWAGALVILCLAIAPPVATTGAFAQGAGPASLQGLAAGAQRSPANRARDPYRHPVEVLTFFGVPDNAAVIEILPGASGYWTEILAPYLRDHGRYIAAIDDRNSLTPEARRENEGFRTKIAADPANYGKVVVAELRFDAKEIVPAGSEDFVFLPAGKADFVLTFRNIHNWMAAGTADKAFATFFRALKPGGILGVEEHRGRADQPQDPAAKSGYVRQDYAVALAEAAGFKLVAASEVNANPRDTKDYSVGVWALPPTYRLKDQDREKYQAIGESDRFVLKFVKP
jgi:predicted methyltransferase